MSIESPYAQLLARIPVSERTLTVLGSETHYWEYGTAAPGVPTVVVVHGFRGDHHGLEPVVAQLPGAHILMPDLPGFGASTPLDAASGARHDVPGYAAWLAAFTAALALPGPVVILGHSFGSIVSSAALADGLSADAVILVNPIGAPALSGPRGIMTRLAVFYYWAAAKLPERIGFALLRSRLIVRVMSVTMSKTRDPQLKRWIHEEHDRYFSAFENRDVVLEAFRASVSHDVSEYAARIPQPTLLIAADRDDITPIAAQHRLQTLFPDARLHVIHDVGHLIHYETPIEAAEQIRTVLSSLGATA
ncbi:alpha/beta fold hydrolase [Microterricola viridarii]|uniref:Pimeloyl-ACP methyl ester carboxylesterase n=1 Tax=Microterricola viridarii TaxID=412690 RepID=A0A1H1UKF1_9MICO|nr:alpha/beta hydrolase [Microterricola viridarii]SDS72978.1 Pimeloyl-ACP methyl ester carboxylesterase [Microterricola viridarii]